MKLRLIIPNLPIFGKPTADLCSTVHTRAQAWLRIQMFCQDWQPSFPERLCGCRGVGQFESSSSARASSSARVWMNCQRDFPGVIAASEEMIEKYPDDSGAGHLLRSMARVWPSRSYLVS